MSDEKRNAIESFLDLPPSTKQTLPTKKSKKDVPAEAEIYDAKDKELERGYEEVKSSAIETFEQIMDDMEEIDPKYRARMYEVASKYLEIGMMGNEKKARIKEHKDKLNKKPTEINNTSNTINMDFSDLVKQLHKQQQGSIIDGEAAVIKTDG